MGGGFTITYEAEVAEVTFDVGEQVCDYYFSMCATVAVLEEQYKAPKQKDVAAIQDRMGLSKLLIMLRNSGDWLAGWLAARQPSQVFVVFFYLHCENMNTPNEWAKQAVNFKFWGARNQV